MHIPENSACLDSIYIGFSFGLLVRVTFPRKFTTRRLSVAPI